ncbi:hypothetical protein HYD67_01985 [Mycoplasmopsis bovis]|nr:hypothetical protein [Mycoplasmopsis bovis]QQH54858.1 hypothetical protein HYD67_01985 [Mycoplasmopsis bovis]
MAHLNLIILDEVNFFSMYQENGNGLKVAKIFTYTFTLVILYTKEPIYHRPLPRKYALDSTIFVAVTFWENATLDTWV